MALQLNDPVPETYKEFYGPIIEQMPRLMAEGRAPLSIVSAEFKCPDFAEVECPFFDVDNKNPYSRQLSFCRELDGFAV